jgi:flavin-dependent dehydrogenase
VSHASGAGIAGPRERACRGDRGAKPPDIDVAIAGGGPAGAIAALVLARAGVRVTVFDRVRFPRHKLCGDTINPGALGLLKRLGIANAAGTCAIDGMLITGTHGVRILGRYPDGVTGRAIVRESFDHAVLSAAADAGAAVEEQVVVQGAASDGAAIDGLYIVGPRGAKTRVTARVVIAADGRHSRVARSVGLGRFPARPRRWAVGGYFTDVAGLTMSGEMHVRLRHYIGVAPLPGGLANACVVTSDRSRLGNPEALLLGALRGDPELRGRFQDARLTAPPAMLGPLALDASAAGVPGLLLAGDAAGFIDPMTGDGLRFAIRGAELAAHAALDVLDTGCADAHLRLGEKRAREFRAKWAFNRGLRRLVESPSAVHVAAFAAFLLPSSIELAIRYAGDVPARNRELGAGEPGPRELGARELGKISQRRT